MKGTAEIQREKGLRGAAGPVGPTRPMLKLVARPGLSLEARVGDALRALWSMSAKGEAKEIVARLGKEYLAAVEGKRPRVSDRLLTRLGSAQAVVRQARAQRQDPVLAGKWERVDRLLDEILTECAG